MKTVLHIDDAVYIFSLTGSIVEDIGYRFLSARSSMHGLAIVASEDINLVLLDLQLPEMDGFAVIECIHGRRPSLPVMALTADAHPETLARSVAAGFCGYLIKPFQPIDLIAAIQQHIK